jgi:hypothetical protein
VDVDKLTVPTLVRLCWVTETAVGCAADACVVLAEAAMGTATSETPRQAEPTNAPMTARRLPTRPMERSFFNLTMSPLSEVCVLGLDTASSTLSQQAARLADSTSPMSVSLPVLLGPATRCAHGAIVK